MITIDSVARVYDRYSGVYDLLFGSFFKGGREIGERLLDLYPGVRVLEVGVGTGLSLPRLAAGAAITGIDVSQDMLDQARSRVQGSAPGSIRLLRMDAARLEFEDGSFDRVYAAYFISTVPDPLQVVREMKRVCRPGGYLVFLNHFQSQNKVLAALEEMISPLCKRLGFRTDLNLAWLIKETGLEVETLERTDFLGHWRAVRCVIPQNRP